MSPEEHREMAQHEADLDLDHKDVRHLLYDIHDESLRRGRPFLETQIHANKRIASLSASVAIMQQQASQDLLNASNQILEASKEGTRTEVAYAEKAQALAHELNASNKRSASLLDAIILTRIKFWRFFLQLLASLCAVECSHDRTAFERPTD
jgi:hypothetical protein